MITTLKLLNRLCDFFAVSEPSISGAVPKLLVKSDFRQKILLVDGFTVKAGEIHSCAALRPPDRQDGGPLSSTSGKCHRQGR